MSKLNNEAFLSLVYSNKLTIQHCLLQSNCLLKPHSAGDVFSTPHSTGGTRILEWPPAGWLQPFECFPVSQNDVP
ncbi:hypothetical protein TNCV_2284871 [Trichonephila clavipes]|nr:hypothetical protein TNCV_2284871 [Trichonephila clavipes]